eukprot:scaffold45188_cov73-Cyclotella_meneghiniana.AAC.1
MTIGYELDERSNPSDGSGQSNRDSSRKSSCDPEANSTQSSRDETIREDEDRGINPEISNTKEEGNSYGKKLQGKLSSVPGVSSVSNQENNTEDTFEKRLYCKMMSSVAEPASTYRKEAKVDQDSSAHKEKSTQS